LYIFARFVFCDLEKVSLIRTLTASKRVWIGLWACVIILGAAHTVPAQRLRNVLFNTPKAYEKQRLPVVHINPDSVRIAAGYEHRIAIDDQIGIRFLNNLDITKGLTQAESGGAGTGGVPFLVNKNGEIDLPAVGKLRVQGLTKQEVKEAVETKYAVQYRDPKVEIAVLNLTVSVQGEVQAPGVYPLMREKTTLLEVLSRAGGITPYGKRRLVKVVRGVGEHREPEILIFDLRQLEAIRTDDMYLQDRDIVYVEPRDIRVVADAVSPYTTMLSILTTLSTLAVIVLNLSNKP
jgi:polysaccharide biosynthesis/export protein